jgi:hypothetical protein
MSPRSQVESVDRKDWSVDAVAAAPEKFRTVFGTAKLFPRIANSGGVKTVSWSSGCAVPRIVRVAVAGCPSASLLASLRWSRRVRLPCTPLLRVLTANVLDVCPEPKARES